MKLGLGTVQFGLDYGISNNRGKVTPIEAASILGIAEKYGISTLDTASHYGCSEQILGTLIDPGKWQVVTKTQTPCVSGEQVEKGLLASLELLGEKSVHGLLMHNAADLLADKSIYQMLLKLREKGVVKKIGASFYSPDLLNSFLDDYDFDIVQVPVNIFDQRFLSPILIDKLVKNDVELHARSIFLQGLLLMNRESIPAYFQPFSPLIERYHNMLSEQKLSPLEACLNFVKNFDVVTKMIVGCCHSSELIAIVEAYKKSIRTDISSLSSNDLALIDPVCWRT